VSSKLYKKKEQEDIPLLSIVVVVVFVMIIFLYDLKANKDFVSLLE